VNSRSAIKGVVIVLVLLGAGILAYVGIVRCVEMKYAAFHEVVPGVLYRCGRMKPEIVEGGVREYGIRTIVDLRAEETAPRGSETESDWAAKQGLRYFNFGAKIISMEELEERVANFLAVATTPECQPVLVNCHHGRTRTGVCVAMYRITQQGWSADKAFDEMISFGLFPSDREEYRKFLLGHANFDWKKYVTIDPGKPEDIVKLRIR